MITPADKAYINTKLIKKGQKKLIGQSLELAQWINQLYDVDVLNIYYDCILPNHRTRIDIIFEDDNDIEKFRTQKYGNYDPQKQRSIAMKYLEISNNTRWNSLLNYVFGKLIKKREVDDPLVVFSSFKPISIIEANEKIPEYKIEELKANAIIDYLWEISRCFAQTTFFLYTENQVQECYQNGMINILKDKYYKLIKQYDEFDYIDEDSFTINVDSKENFDANYDSNWYYYYK